LTCSPEEKQLIIQLKLFHAIKHGWVDDAQTYLDLLFERNRVDLERNDRLEKNDKDNKFDRPATE
jgi:hypothetical protein